MQGCGFEDPSDVNNEQRGLQPRVFDYIFVKIRNEMGEGGSTQLLKCSYFEIYNEQIIDLV